MAKVTIEIEDDAEGGPAHICFTFDPPAYTRDVIAEGEGGLPHPQDATIITPAQAFGFALFSHLKPWANIVAGRRNSRDEGGFDVFDIYMRGER